MQTAVKVAELATREPAVEQAASDQLDAMVAAKAETARAVECVRMANANLVCVTVVRARVVRVRVVRVRVVLAKTELVLMVGVAMVVSGV